MKKWKAKVELFWSADHVETVEVKANTEKKAKMYARDKALKQYGEGSNPRVISLKAIEETNL